MDTISICLANRHIDAAQKTFPVWDRVMNMGVADFIPWAGRSRSSSTSSATTAVEDVPPQIPPTWIEMSASSAKSVSNM